MSTECVPFWVLDPQILVSHASEFFPFTEHDRRCTGSALNSFTRFGIYLGIVLALIRFEWMWLLIGVVFGAFSVGAWFYMDHTGAVRDGFMNIENNEGFELLTADNDVNEFVPDIIGTDKRTFPTMSNPFMNVLLTEISNPTMNLKGNAVKSEMDGFFDTMFAKDPNDVFNHTQDQRTWVMKPTTNDQGAFADWLYRVPGQTCKEGNLAACNFFTTGAESLPWRGIG